MRTGILAICLTTLVIAGAGHAQAPVARAAPPTAPSAETLALARQVAQRDDFLMMIRSSSAPQIDQILSLLGTLTPAEHDKAVAIARAKMEEGLGHAADTLAPVYAATFTPAELRAIAAFQATPAGQAYADRLIKVLPALGDGMRGFDFRGQVLAATCAQMNKGCPTTPGPPPPGA